MTSRAPLVNVADLTESGCRIVESRLELRATIERLLDQAASFFHLSDLRLKMPYHTNAGEGYRPFASEYTDSRDQPDLVECFSCSLPRSAVKTGFPSGLGLALYEALLGAHSIFAALAEATSRELFRELGIGLATGFRFGFLEWSRLQINFGVTERVTRELLNVRHEDGNFLTIAFSTAPGLELVTSHQTRDLWRPDASELVILAGEILSLATSGRVRTGFHQVRRRRDVRERIAILYFADACPCSLTQLRPSISAQDFYERITEGWLRSGVAPVQTRHDVRADNGAASK